MSRLPESHTSALFPPPADANVPYTDLDLALDPGPGHGLSLALDLYRHLDLSQGHGPDHSRLPLAAVAAAIVCTVRLGPGPGPRRGLHRHHDRDHDHDHDLVCTVLGISPGPMADIGTDRSPGQDHHHHHRIDEPCTIEVVPDHGLPAALLPEVARTAGASLITAGRDRRLLARTPVCREGGGGPVRCLVRYQGRGVERRLMVMVMMARDETRASKEIWCQDLL